MNNHNCLVILFNPPHQALRGEKALKDAEIEHSVINTPREFSVDCGISLRIAPALANRHGLSWKRSGSCMQV
jgi:Putative Se/S carrier protein-like